MRSDELAARIRLKAQINDSDDDYTLAQILIDATAAQLGVFVRAAVQARAGYWLKRTFVSTASGTAKYRFPARAVAQGLERIEIADSSGVYGPLHELTPKQAMDAEGAAGSTGRPHIFYCEGDCAVPLPVPDGVYTLRERYYLRPSRLTTQQSSALNGGTVRGQVTAVNTSTRVIAVNVIPHDMLDVSPAAAITSGSQRIDVVKPDGWHEVVLVGATQTWSGLNITVGGTDSMEEIALGDFVRAADQTDWPHLPEEFHEALALVTASRICNARGQHVKAQALLGEAGDDLQRFLSLLTPRVKDDPRRAIPSGGPIRRGGVPRSFIQ